MTKTAFTGPLIVYGSRNPPGNSGATNPDKAASLFDKGTAIMDGRAGYNVTRAGAIGWYNTADIPVIDQAPSTLSATNIAGSQPATAGSPLALAGASTGITVLATALQVWASGNSVPVGALVLDGNPGLVSMYGGQANPATGNTIAMFYDPTKALARNVRVTTNADDSAGFYNVAGYDIYGYPMTEKIAGVSSGIAAGKKAFKFITSITPSGTVASTGVTVGTGDVFGFPLRVGTVGYVKVWWASTLATALATPFSTASAFTFADANPPSNTTGDVRGTIYVGTATPSNGTRLLQVYITPSVNAQTVDGGLFGLTQA